MATFEAEQPRLPFNRVDVRLNGKNTLDCRAK